MVLSHFAIKIKNQNFRKIHQKSSTPTPPPALHQLQNPIKNIEKCIKNCSNHLKNMFFDVFEPFRNENKKPKKMKNFRFFTKNHEKACWPHYRMIKLRVHFHTTPKRKSLIKFDSDLRSPKQNMFFNSARRDLSFEAIKMGVTVLNQKCESCPSGATTFSKTTQNPQNFLGFWAIPRPNLMKN